MLSEKKISAPKHKIICGNTLDALRELPKESIDMVMTSPPYWSLRDYGEDTTAIWDGDKDSEHEWIDNTYVRNTDITAGEKQKTNKGSIDRDNPVNNAFCSKCGAWHGQLGLEPTPELYIEHLRMVFVEVKRVLKKTGTCWMNIGDTYASSGGADGDYNNDGLKEKQSKHKQGNANLPAKCMCMIPERFAFMMIDLGYILRNKIIWHKPNPMPSSVKDRFNTTYEMLYLFSKNRKYWFDLDAVREEHKEISLKRCEYGWHGNLCDNHSMSGIKNTERMETCHPLGKNPGDFWSINTQSFPEAHFAVFPEKLCEKPILAGCPAGVCKHCGMARIRITEQGKFIQTGGKRIKNTPALSEKQKKEGTDYHLTETIGWLDCQCEDIDKYEPGIILDPFGGSGTVSVEAEKLGRSSITIDIKKEYCKMAFKGLSKLALQTKLDGRRSTIECINF